MATILDDMRLKKKSGYHHGDLRQTLIDASIDVIDKHGIDRLNLRELAKRVGVSPGAPYHHFGSREELLASISQEGFQRLEATMISECDGAPADSSARLEALGRGYVSFAIAHRGHFRVMFRGESHAGDASLEGASKRAFQLLQEAVEACQAAGTAPAGDSRPLVLVAWSTVHGLAMLWVDSALPPTHLDPRQLAPLVTNLTSRMFAALARESPAAPGLAR
jgi:AcrR family transcriptional regulator